MNGNIPPEKETIKLGTTIERDLVVQGTHIHIKSVFNGKIPIEKALGNIAVRKLSVKKKI